MKTTFVTSFDEKYFDYAKVAVKSLDNNSQGKTDVVCLVPQEMLAREKEFVYSIEPRYLLIRFASSEHYGQSHLDSYNAQDYLTPNMNHRVVMQDLLGDCDRAIYFDPDTLFLRDVSPMIHYPDTNRLLAVQENLGQAEQSFGSIDIPYFNNGFFIADMKFWKEYDAQGKMTEYLRNNPNARCPDQDAMNYVFREHWSQLPLSFNCFNYLFWEDNIVSLSNQNPIMVHFVGPDKPWDRSLTKWSEEWNRQYNLIMGV